MSLDDLVLDYLAHLGSERGLSPATISAYRRDLAQYRDFLNGRESDPELVSAFVARLHERGLARASIARKVAALRGMHRFAAAEGMADTDPSVLVESPGRSRSLPRASRILENSTTQ